MNSRWLYQDSFIKCDGHSLRRWRPSPWPEHLLLQLKRRGVYSKHGCIWAWNTSHTRDVWIMGGSSKTHLSRNKESCRYKVFHAYHSCHIWFDYEPTTSFHKYGRWAFFDLSLLSSMAVWCWSPLALRRLSGLHLDEERPFANGRSLVSDTTYSFVV